ncbi:RluA family pseudouridine synthase [Pseudodesulfovibrio cashew]|uniref:RluA family pseudouridine synthase n=1 Tax=Pseudodesulfovibrio cashew TaxID=2678688 RepID=A0A6I6JJT1_9BACT|nr:RluA family pseudouridine synthase [Pseudodesulfovibrio cashew]QGY41399.1 RluA family pseudouridine synthase [Pseudodesulfovibrio cashew]
MSAEISFIVPESSDGLRLDKVLASPLPESGLRLRRRLCDEGRVRVSDAPRKPGYKVRAGQEILINREQEAVTHSELGVFVVEKTGDFAAVYKPGGVHSAAIEGKDDASVEAVLPDLFDGEVTLLNRLDFLTSGLLLVALNPEAATRYQELEEAGQLRKFYLAEVQGRLDGLATVKNALDTDDRKKTRVLEGDNPDEGRWTGVETLSHDHETRTTLVRCLIKRGARHQIRAHLASIGHPIVGDSLYGSAGNGGLRLHHQRIEFPGFVAEASSPF